MFKIKELDCAVADEIASSGNTVQRYDLDVNTSEASGNYENVRMGYNR